MQTTETLEVVPNVAYHIVYIICAFVYLEGSGVIRRHNAAKSVIIVVTKANYFSQEVGPSSAVFCEDKTGYFLFF